MKMFSKNFSLLLHKNRSIKKGNTHKLLLRFYGSEFLCLSVKSTTTVAEHNVNLVAGVKDN